MSLLSGPALALAAATSTTPLVPALVAGVGAGLVGGYDDAATDSSDKGLRGHAAALRSGRLTTGGVKVLGLGALGLAAGQLLGGSRTERLLAAGVVAAAANMLNLFDLRPGRALKVGGLWAAALSQPGPAAAAAALLPGDLGEQTMLGDCGANALGAVLGVAACGRLRSMEGRAGLLATLAGLTLASEVVSFSRVIDAVPTLRWLDRAGRR